MNGAGRMMGVGDDERRIWAQSIWKLEAASQRKLFECMQGANGTQTLRYDHCEMHLIQVTKTISIDKRSISSSEPILT